MNQELRVIAQKIETMTPNKVNALVETKTKEILTNIQNCTDKIQRAKEAAEDANSMDIGGVFGRGKRTAAKATATAEALTRTNEAVSELSHIVKESIAFTCLSMAFAEKMSESIAQMMAEGFEDSNGNYISLSDDAKVQAEIILKQAKNYVNSQLQIKELETKQKEKDKLDRIQSAKIKTLEIEFENKTLLDKKQDELISSNIERLNKKDRVDALQTKRLKELSILLKNKNLLDQKQEIAIRKLFEYTKQKDELDKKQSETITNHEKAIKELFELTKQKTEWDKKQSEEIKEIMKTKRSNILSLISLIISLLSMELWLYMVFLR